MSEPRGTVRLGPGELLTAIELAELLGVQPSTLHDWARQGILPSFKPGRRRYFVRADVEVALTRLRDEALDAHRYR
jgi:excisionase family DNA binding protein